MIPYEQVQGQGRFTLGDSDHKTLDIASVLVRKVLPERLGDLLANASVFLIQCAIHYTPRIYRMEQQK